jgi:predicted GNAT superfamily acetyltransferase
VAFAELASLPRAFGVEGDPDMPLPATPILPAELPSRFLVPIPARIQEMKAKAPAIARAWREATRSVFTNTVGGAYEVLELLRGEGPLSYYLLERRKGEKSGVGNA